MWESATPDWPPRTGIAERFKSPDFALAFARIVTHYVRHNAWLEDGILLRNADALSNIEGVLVNGRFDFQAPIANAWELRRAWPRAAVVIVDERRPRRREDQPGASSSHRSLRRPDIPDVIGRP